MKQIIKKESPMLGKVLKKIAPQIGAKVSLEPEWGIIGQIIFRNGRHSYFKFSALDLNPLGSSEVSKDKDYSNFFMKSLGYPIVPGSKTFYSDAWAKTIGMQSRNIDAAYEYAIKLKLPVIVKPNSGTQGAGVFLVHSKKEFYSAMKEIFKADRVALVQRPLKGKDYRIVVLDSEVISAYERIALSITGDGKSSVEKLLKKKQQEFIASSRDTKIKTDDSRIAAKLRQQNLTLASIPSKDEKIFLLDNANLSTGGDSVDVTKDMHPEFKEIAIKLTGDMGLRLCGVDLMVQGDISKKPEKYWVLEINSAPGLDHYAKLGRTQKKVVEDLYLEVLKRLEQAVS